MTQNDEECIRRAVRSIVQRSREAAESDDVQDIFDLLRFLQPDAFAIVQDETTLTLAHIVGGD